MVRDLRPLDALKTYRYLRIGMIGAVVLMAVAIALEVTDASCLQNSISAYYYTPVRPIFVGSLFAIGLALIVYKGRTWREDLSLNLAGMLAPVVAVVPTTDVGPCFSGRDPRPLSGDVLADWVVAIIDNNVEALLITGALALVGALVVWQVTRRLPRGRPEIEPGATWTMVAMGGLLTIATLLFVLRRDAFIERAHGGSAVLMFVGLFGAILFSALEQKDVRKRWLTRVYVAIAALMLVGALVILVLFDQHEVFALETWEILLFAVYWSLQTVENWYEGVAEADGPAGAPAPA